MRGRAVPWPPATRRVADCMTAEIAITGVSKTFETSSGYVHAFGPAQISIMSGEFISFLGPSGCGKSTLLLMVAGILAPTEGAISVSGTRVERPRTDVGIMFQDNTLVPWRTVKGNIELQLELRGLDVLAHQERVARLIGQVHLEGFASRYPHELSGGMQQRAALCQTLVHSPRTLLLDEPLGKLDAMTREAIRRDLQSLWMSERPTVLLVTHSIEEAIQLSSRVCVITPRPGKIGRIIDIELPWPRDLAVKQSRRFAEYLAEIQEMFRGYGVI